MLLFWKASCLRHSAVLTFPSMLLCTAKNRNDGDLSVTNTFLLFTPLMIQTVGGNKRQISNRKQSRTVQACEECNADVLQVAHLNELLLRRGFHINTFWNWQQTQDLRGNDGFTNLALGPSLLVLSGFLLEISSLIWFLSNQGVQEKCSGRIPK